MRMEERKVETEKNIVVFEVGGETFGADIWHVQEIILPVKVVPIPKSHPNLEGVAEIRGEVLPVIDAAKALGFGEGSGSGGEDRFMIANVLGQKVIFHVDRVLSILPCPEEETAGTDELTASLEGLVTGTLKRDEGIILLLDLEKLVGQIKQQG